MVKGDGSAGPVLHVVASTDRRGAETAAVELAQVLVPPGEREQVVALAPGDVGGLDLPVLGRSRFSASGLSGLRRRSRSAAVVIAHGSSTLPAVAAATMGTGVPFVYRSIGDPLAWATTRARRARVSTAASRAAAVVALWSGSAVTWHELLRVPADRLVVIPNAAALADFDVVDEAGRRAARAELGLDPEKPLALCLGALSPEKRVDLAIEASSRLGDLELIIVGEGPERARLEAVAQARMSGRAHFLGQTARPQGSLAAADVLVLPSDTEGQPRVAIEAGLSGLPVVATMVGGLNEVIEDGRTGLLVPPGDAQALADAIQRTLDARQRMGQAARLHCATRFDLSKVAEQWRTLLKRVMVDV